MLWWFIKVQIFVFIFIWLRGTLPRMRYDQFMKFGWKVLIPVSVVWIVIVSAARLVRDDDAISTTDILITGAAVIVLLLLGSWIVSVRQDRRQRVLEEAEAEAAAAPFDPMAGGFPVPPLPGQSFTYTSRRAAAAGTTIVQEAMAPSTQAVTQNDSDEEGTHA
jgi:NADH-quinone oxidoreductase subunit H